MAAQACLLWTSEHLWRLEPACWHEPKNRCQQGAAGRRSHLQAAHRPGWGPLSAFRRSHTRLAAAILHQFKDIRAAAEPLPILIRLLTDMALGSPQHDPLQKLHERQGPIRAMLLKRLQQQVVPVGTRIVWLMSQKLQQALQAHVNQGECFSPALYLTRKPCSPTIGTSACLHQRLGLQRAFTALRGVLARTQDER